MTAEKGKRAAYTLEFKLEAVRLVQGGHAYSVTAKLLGVPKATLGNWVRRATLGKLAGVGAKPISAEQMEPARGETLPQASGHRMLLRGVHPGNPSDAGLVQFDRAYGVACLRDVFGQLMEFGAQSVMDSGDTWFHRFVSFWISLSARFILPRLLLRHSYGGTGLASRHSDSLLARAVFSVSS